MAATAAQVLANRENAKRSTGPRTEEGLKRSSQNACAHNLTGGPALAPGEDPAEYQAHLKQFEKDYQPDGQTETFIVHQIADAVWRLNRCTRMEEELMAKSANPFAEENDDLLRRLERLQRYRKSIESSFFRYRKEWKEILRLVAEQAQTGKPMGSVDHIRALIDEDDDSDYQPQYSATTPETENRRL